MCSSCGRKTDQLQQEIKILRDENNFLKAENVALKKEVEELYKRIEERNVMKPVRQQTAGEPETSKSTPPANLEKTEPGKIKKPVNGSGAGH